MRNGNQTIELTGADLTPHPHHPSEHVAIGHFHTAGNPGRNELDETQELYYPPIMKTIAAADYGGYVGQEFSPPTGGDGGGGGVPGEQVQARK